MSTSLSQILSGPVYESYFRSLLTFTPKHVRSPKGTFTSSKTNFVTSLTLPHDNSGKTFFKWYRKKTRYKSIYQSNMNPPPIILLTKGDIIVMARYGYMQYGIFTYRTQHRIYFLDRDPSTLGNSKIDLRFLISWIQKSPHYSIYGHFLVIDIDQVLDPEIKERLLKLQKVIQNGFG